MSIKTIWNIILKSIGIYFLISNVGEFFYTIMFSFEDGLSNNLPFSSLPPFVILLVNLAISAILIFKTDWCIQLFKLEKASVENDKAAPFDVITFFAMTLMCLGGWFILTNAIHIVTQFIDYFLMKVRNNDLETKPISVYQVVFLIFGVILLTNGRSIAAFMFKKAS